MPILLSAICVATLVAVPVSAQGKAYLVNKTGEAVCLINRVDPINIKMEMYDGKGEPCTLDHAVQGGVLVPDTEMLALELTKDKSPLTGSLLAKGTFNVMDAKGEKSLIGNEILVFTVAKNHEAQFFKGTDGKAKETGPGRVTVLADKFEHGLNKAKIPVLVLTLGD